MTHVRRFVSSMMAVFLLLLVAGFANGQVGACNGTGCDCDQRVYACCLQVRENANNGSSVGSALIYNPFNNFTQETGFSIDYFGMEENLGLFNIDNNGLLTVNRSADREDDQQGNCLRIVITLIDSDEAVSNPFTIFAINIVDENDNAPMFSASELQLIVPETTGTNSLVCSGDMRSTLRATDADALNNSMVRYRIAEGMGNETFYVGDQTQPCISNREVLDRESQPNYTCTLIAEDQGSEPLASTATVTFVLLDLNDNSPQFINPPAELTIPENENMGYIIHQFQANDSDLEINREIRFDISLYSPTTDPLPFAINATTGELSLISVLDYETTPSYRVTICAIDRGVVPMTGETEVTINVLDRNDPLNIETQFFVQEIEENSDALIVDMVAIVLITIRDFDEEPNTENTATLETGQEFFEINSILSLRIHQIFQTEVIDREMNSTIKIVVRVNGGGDPPFTEYVNFTVNITDVNDNDPELHETQFTLLEEETSGTRIGSLSDAAYDLDQGNNGRVGTYRLLSVISEDQTDLTDAFALVNSGGNLLPNGRLVAPTIDREIVGTFLTCVVQLTDMGEPNNTASRSFTVQILDKNDNSPEFQNDNYEFTLMENRPRLEHVGRVIATDPDNEENGTVIYDIEPKGNFIVDHEGVIWSNDTFDRETAEMYRIAITAHDNATEPNVAKNPTRVTINIGDENDSPPMFTEIPEPFNIDSNREIGYRIFVFNNIVVDPDAAGPSNTVFFSLSPSEQFSIDRTTGELSVIQKLQITEVPFNLTVTAYNNVSDIKLQNSITITINVIEAFPLLIVGASAAGSAIFVLILIVVVSFVMVCLCCKNRRGKFVINDQNSNLNNQIQKPILKTVPAEPTALMGDRRGRVKFSGRVDETHYDYEQAVGDSSVYRKQSTTNFGSGSSDESPATPPRLHHNGNIPIEGINGDVPAHISHFNMHRPRQRSPLVYRPEMTTAVEMHEYSQGSTIDDTTGYNSIDGNSEDESTFSDDASNMNTSIPCFQGDDHAADMRYPAQLHTHIHQHEPPPPHLPSLPVHHNVQLPSYHHAQYPSPHEDLTLTPQQNGSVSSHSHSPTHAPIPSHQTLIPPPRRAQMHGGSRNYPHPLVMPDAYPRGPPDIPRFEAYMPSYQSDYDTSTYASTELDEALGFNMDTEPGFYSLTATDCDEQEDTQL